MPALLDLIFVHRGFSTEAFMEYCSVSAVERFQGYAPLFLDYIDFSTMISGLTPLWCPTPIPFY